MSRCGSRRSLLLEIDTMPDSDTLNTLTRVTFTTGALPRR
jgi:hypothetical protein